MLPLYYTRLYTALSIILGNPPHPKVCRILDIYRVNIPKWEMKYFNLQPTMVTTYRDFDIACDFFFFNMAFTLLLLSHVLRRLSHSWLLSLTNISELPMKQYLFLDMMPMRDDCAFSSASKIPSIISSMDFSLLQN